LNDHRGKWSFQCDQVCRIQNELSGHRLQL
jgi:hypothetical protein